MSNLGLREADGGWFVDFEERHVGAVRLTDRDSRNYAQVVIADLPHEPCVELVGWLREHNVGVLLTRASGLRFAARGAGFGGTLRGPLVDSGASPLELLDELQALLPNTEVALLKTSRLRNVWTSAISGVSGMQRISFERDGESIVAVLPANPVIDGEVLAAAVDTTFSVHARFGPASSFVRVLSFDQSSHGMAEGKVAGTAARMRGEIHLNAQSVLPLVHSGRLGRPPQSPEPWLRIDETVAHELWHKLEMAWETERFMDSVEFRKEVGQLFGCATIEQVFTNDEARTKLATEVTDYATTNRLEATAEMFELWWCGPAPDDSVAARFGAIVDRYFPPS